MGVPDYANAKSKDGSVVIDVGDSQGTVMLPPTHAHDSLSTKIQRHNSE